MRESELTTSRSSLLRASQLVVKQKRELAELFGFETRNKYSISSEAGEIAFAAEQQKGLFGILLRQFLGHWRTFEISFFDTNRQPLFHAFHPFRLFFQRLEVFTPDGHMVGAIQQRWSFFSKRFDVLNSMGEVIFEMNSGLFRVWTFPFLKNGRQVGLIEKKWSGVFNEMFTDKDNFRIQFTGELELHERMLMLAAAVFVDLQYFERKAD